MEAVSEFWSGQYHHSDEVADKPETADDTDEESIAVVFEVDHCRVIGEVGSTVGRQSSTDIKCPIEHVRLSHFSFGLIPIKNLTFQSKPDEEMLQ